MPEVTRWVFTICCGTMICGVVSILTPEKGSQRLMGMVLGLFMLCCFLLPAGLGLELDPTGLALPEAASAMEDAHREITRYFMEDTARLARKELEEELEQELAADGINGEDFQIYIEADDPEKAGPGLRVTVTLPPEHRDRREELQNRLEQKLGIGVTVRCRGEDDREGL